MRVPSQQGKRAPSKIPSERFGPRGLRFSPTLAWPWEEDKKTVYLALRTFRTAMEAAVMQTFLVHLQLSHPTAGNASIYVTSNSVAVGITYRNLY